MKTFAAFVAVLGLGLGTLAQGQEKDKGEKKDKGIQGRFTVVGGEKHGEKVPPERVKGSILLFTKNSIVGTDKDKKEFFGSDYTLDTSKTPWRISMTSTAPKKGEKAEGIIQWDGDTLKIAYALPGGETPKSFDKTKTKQHMFWLKRVKE
jgi:uncharacterized protein (TIGR03067 family)